MNWIRCVFPKSVRFVACLIVLGVAAGSLALLAGSGTRKQVAGKFVREVPRPLDDGRYLLPNGWSISPAGRQVALGGLPLKVIAFPDDRHVLVTSNGYTENFVAVIDTVAAKITQRVPIKQGWLGLAVSPDGRTVYASAGGEDRVLVFRFAAGTLTAAPEIALAKGVFPAGLALNRQGNRLFVTGNLDDALHIVDLENQETTLRVPVGIRPYTCAPTADGKTVYVSNWGEDTIAVVDVAAAKRTKTIKVQDHPNDLLLTPQEDRLFVANGNQNTVSVIDTQTAEVIEQIDVALRPKAPLGSTPNALLLDADGDTLFVANADNNAVAVFDIETKGHSASRGFIPSGWYPTALCLTGNGKKLVIANGKGSISQPNAAGWKGADGDERTNPGYIAKLLEGTLSIVDLPDERTLARYSEQVYRNSPFGRVNRAATPAPFPLGDHCPLQHVVYIIKENRTYDQIFGDIPEGNGDPSYCLFPEEVTPNHHALARQFVLFDNFYHDAEVSADGHHWVTSAYATDYVEKLWPNMYAGRSGRGRQDVHDDPVAFSQGGFLWDLCQKAGISYRSFGEFARIRGAEPGKVRAATPSLEGHIHLTYLGADGISAMSDSKRLELWLTDFRDFEKQGQMPRLQILSLPGDHTLGTRPKVQTPRAMLAENDVALGKIVEAVSRSKFWNSTAIFVIEDDAQNGPDHVDCHRSIALVISPYNRRRFVDGTMYSTSSVLRTMELILGLPPLTQFDAAATPMWAAFQTEPDVTPFEAAPPRIPLDEQNLASAYGADRSLALSLDEADTAPDAELNEILWKAIRGADSPVPPRRVAAFVAEQQDE